MSVWFAGVLILLGLVIYFGADTVLTALLAAGWGLAVVTAFHLLPMAADTMAWRCLLDSSSRPSFIRLLWIRWIGESVNSLLPAAQIGGDVVRGRLASHSGVPGEQSAASIIVDLTLSVCTLILFAIVGVLLAVRHMNVDVNVISMAGWLLVSTAVIAIFILLQRLGLFSALVRGLAAVLSHHDWDRIIGGANQLDRSVERIYSRRRSLGASTAWALAAWILGAGEIWLAMYFLGYPIGILEAIMLESLVQAVRSAAFPVPGAWGVQEGGFVLLGMMAGIPVELALAASLVKRVRELGLGVPGLIVWQMAEARRWQSATG